MDFNSEKMGEMSGSNIFNEGKSVVQSSFYENFTVPYCVNTEPRVQSIETDTTTITIVVNSTYVDRDETVAVLEMTVSATILFLAIVGNSCVILSLATRRKRLSRMHLMILHLSLADLFVAFFNVLPQLAWDITHTFIGGHFLCVSVKYVQVVAMYASSYVLLATAVDRFYAICHPFVSQTWTARHAHTLAVIAWAASLFFSLPQVFIFSYRLREVVSGVNVYDCWAQFDPEWTLRAYITWMTASIFVVPTCMLGVLYGKITWVVWKAGKFEESTMMKFSSAHIQQKGNSKIASNRGSPDNTNKYRTKQSISATGQADVKHVCQTTRQLSKMGASGLTKAPQMEPGDFPGLKRNFPKAAEELSDEGSPHPDDIDHCSKPPSLSAQDSENQNFTRRSYANNSKHKSPGSEISPDGLGCDSESLDSDSIAKNESGNRGISAKTPKDVTYYRNVTRTEPHVYPVFGVKVGDEGCTSLTAPRQTKAIDEERANKHVDTASRLPKGYSRCADKTRSGLMSDVKLDSRDPEGETLCLSDIRIQTKKFTEERINERNNYIFPKTDMAYLDSCLQKRASFKNYKYMTTHGQRSNSDWQGQPNLSGEPLESTSDSSGNNSNYARQINENNLYTSRYQFLDGGIDTRNVTIDSQEFLSQDLTTDLTGSDRTLTKLQKGSSLTRSNLREQKHGDINCKHIAKTGIPSNKVAGDRHMGTENDRITSFVPQGNMGISRAKIKTIKMTLTVVICYVLCWAPFFVGQMWAAYDENAPYDGPFFSIIMLLASVNSCTNPWIYTIFSNTICQRTQEVLTAPCRWLAKACRTQRRCDLSRRTSAHSVCLRP